jgi:long-chain acyl-CoA synthetase
MGYIDDRGFLHINGRKKEMLVLPSGEKVFPQDIEPHFSAYPLIKESIICNMSSRPGKERVGAIVVVDEEYYKEISLKETVSIDKMVDGIIDEINEKLARYKKISGFKIRYEEFPKTTTSKIKRHLIKWDEQ